MLQKGNIISSQDNETKVTADHEAGFRVSRPLRSVPLKPIVEQFNELLNPYFGPLEIEVTGPCSQERPMNKSLVFVSEVQSFLDVLASSASAIVIPENFKDSIPKDLPPDKTILLSKNPYLCMALVNQTFFALPFLKETFNGKNIHPGAHISKDAQIDSTAIIQPGVVISAHVTIGKNTYIGANTVIEPHTQIGDNCFIHPQVYIGHSCKLGNRVEVKPHSTVGSDGYGYAHDSKGNHTRIPHYGAVIIEDDVHIGANVNIDRGTFEPARIGAGTKIDNHCHFGHNVQIGKNCLITAGMITAGSVTIGDNCIFGGRTTVNGHISIASGCMFAGLTGINKTIEKPGKYGGFPAVEFRNFLRIQSTLTQLPTLRKTVSEISKKLGLIEKERDLE